MAENGLPNDALPKPEQDSAVKGRRDFFKRAALVSVPVVLATVRAQNAWAGGWTPPVKGQASCLASVSTSGCK